MSVNGMLLMGAGFGGSSASVSAEASQFLARLPDTPDSTHKDAYIALIDGLVADSLWSKLVGLWITATDTSGNSLIDLTANANDLTTIGSPSFTADEGYTFPSGAGLDTGIVLTSASPYTLNSAAAGIYNRTARAANAGFNFGVLGANTKYLYGRLRIAGDNTDFDLNAITFPTVANASSDGMFVYSRTAASGAGAQTVYRNGSSIGTSTGASDAIPTTRTCYIGALNNNGTLSNGPSSDEIAAFFLSSGLNGTEASNISSRINTYMTAIGKNVY